MILLRVCGTCGSRNVRDVQGSQTCFGGGVNEGLVRCLDCRATSPPTVRPVVEKIFDYPR